MENATQKRCRTFEETSVPKLELSPESTEQSPDRLLTTLEVAEMLSVDVSWVKNHCTRVAPFLPYVRLGGGRYAMRRFRRDQIMEFIEQNTHQSKKRA